jgi:plasmid stabilization system protein ParE
VADVSFLPAAEADYQDALAWYQARSPRAADRFQAAVDDSLQSIAAHSEMYGLLDDQHRGCVLRRYPYTIVYRVVAGDVIVVAVAHARRSSAFWQGRS